MASTFGKLDVTFQPRFMSLVSCISSESLQNIENRIGEFCGYNFKLCITKAVVTENGQAGCWYAVDVIRAIYKLIETGLLFHWVVLKWAQEGIPSENQATWHIKMVTTLNCPLVKDWGCLPVPTAVNLNGSPCFFVICYNHDTKKLSPEIKDQITLPLDLEPANFYVMRILDADDDETSCAAYGKIIMRFLAWGLLQEWGRQRVKTHPQSQHLNLSLNFLLEKGDIPITKRAASFPLAENLYLTCSAAKCAVQYRVFNFPSFVAPFTSSLINYIWVCLNLEPTDVVIDPIVGERPSLRQPEPGNGESESVVIKLERCFTLVTSPGCEYDVRKDATWRLRCFENAVAAASATGCLDTFLSEVYIALLKNFTTGTAQSIMKELVVKSIENAITPVTPPEPQPTVLQNVSSDGSVTVINNFTHSVTSEGTSGNNESMMLPARELSPGVSGASTSSTSRHDSYYLQVGSFEPLTFSNYNVKSLQQIVHEEIQTQLMQSGSASDYPSSSTSVASPPRSSESTVQFSDDCQPAAIAVPSDLLRQSQVNTASHRNVEVVDDAVNMFHSGGHLLSSEERQLKTTVSEHTVVSTVELRRTVVTTVDHQSKTVVTTLSHQQTNHDNVNGASPTNLSTPLKGIVVRNTKRKKPSVGDGKSRKKVGGRKNNDLPLMEILTDGRKYKISKKEGMGSRQTQRKQALASQCDEDNMVNKPTLASLTDEDPAMTREGDAPVTEDAASSSRSKGLANEQDSDKSRLGSTISNLCFNIPPEWCLPGDKAREDTNQEATADTEQRLLRESKPFGKQITKSLLKITPELCRPDDKEREDRRETESDGAKDKRKGSHCSPTEVKPSVKPVSHSLLKIPPEWCLPAEKAGEDPMSDATSDIKPFANQVPDMLSKIPPEWCLPADKAGEDTIPDATSDIKPFANQVPDMLSKIPPERCRPEGSANEEVREDAASDSHVKEDGQCPLPESNNFSLTIADESISVNAKENGEQLGVKGSSSTSAASLGKQSPPRTENSSPNGNANLSGEKNESVKGPSATNKVEPTLVNRENESVEGPLATNEVEPTLVRRENVSSDDEIMEVVEVSVKRKVWKGKSKAPMVDKACQTDTLIIDIDED